MGTCCSRSVSPDGDGEVAEREAHQRHGKNATSREVKAAAKRKGCSLDAAATHRLGYQGSSASTESLTGIPSAINDTKKGFEHEHTTHSSSDNSGSQLQAFPNGCMSAAEFNSLARHPREGDEANSATNITGSGSTMPRYAMPSSAGRVQSYTPLNGNAGALPPTRRAPRQALLSYAEQYRTLQPFLRRRLRNRRWRLIFSSDVHGVSLLDRCQRVFREEEVQWHAVVAAAKQHNTLTGPNSSARTTAADADEGMAMTAMSDGSGMGLAAAGYTLVPVLALMETTIVVPAPKNNAASSATSNDYAGSPDGGEPPAADHDKRRPSTVVDSHVCVGLYFERRPIPDSVTSYSRSEVFFFLFQSPIQPTSTAEAAAADAQPQGEHPPPHEVSAPPPSTTQTNRRQEIVSGDLTGVVTCEAGEESGETLHSSPLNRSSATLAPSSAGRGDTPRTQTHRLNGTRDRGDARESDADALDSPLSPPRVGSTAVGQQRHSDVNASVDLMRAFDRHSSVVDERRSRVQDATAGEQPPPQQQQELDPPTPNGILSSQWQHRVQTIEQEQQLQQRNEERTEDGGSGTNPHTSPAASPPPPHRDVHDGGAGNGNDDDTFSSASAAPADGGEVDATVHPRRSVTRRPPELQGGPLSNSDHPQQSPHSRNNSGSPHRATREPSGPPVATVAPTTAQSTVTRTWAAEPVGTMRSPTTPVSPRSTLDPPPQNGGSVFGGTPLTVTHLRAQSPTGLDLHPLGLHEADDSLTLEDDLVSASTTVVSATSVPGGGMTWREDEDLSSYWPEASPAVNGTAGGAYGASRNNNNNSSNVNDRHRQEWYSPANGPQLPPLSRASSFGGDDTAECLTPRLPGGATTTAFAGPDAFEREPSTMVEVVAQNNNTNGNGADSTSPPLPGLSVSANASTDAATTSVFGHLPSVTTTMVGDSVGFSVSTTAAAATMAAGVAGPSAQSVRPVSTHVEVLTVTPPHDTVAESSGEGNLHSEMPSRIASQLTMTEGGIDVYCTSTGALYVWDPHRERAATAHGVADAASGSSSEHEFLYQRDTSGIRWNVGYFARLGYGGEPASGSPVGHTGHSSLFSFVRAQARQTNVGVGPDVMTAGEDSTEVLTSSVVKLQLCAVSSRSMPPVLHRAPSTILSGASASAATVPSVATS